MKFNQAALCCEIEQCGEVNTFGALGNQDPMQSCHIWMRSLHDVHAVKAYRADYALSFRPCMYFNSKIFGRIRIKYGGHSLLVATSNSYF
jgi:hypothetical protein